MCGIAGYFFSRPRKEMLLCMISQLRHRGPDGHGYYIDDRAGLAHARLSIIDLEHGHQPITNEDETIWITFNGEIYNYLELRELLESKGHRFRTNSDTEVIVHAYEEYGFQCASMFNGQFAYAIWDSKEKIGHIARDRVGIQPLYYTNHDGTVYFGSEVKSLYANMSLRKGLNTQELANVFKYWSPSMGNSVFEGIGEVEPGQILIFNEHGADVGTHGRSCYWDHSYDVNIPKFGLEHHMGNAVDFRLRADVPVASYLSGGLDSSIIAALAAQRKHEQLRTFSIEFEQDQYDESNYQADVIRHIGVNHTAFLCTKSDIAHNFPTAVYHAEKPMFRTAPVPMYLLSRMVKTNGFKVVLTGEGADEVFAGYDIFRENYVRRVMATSTDTTYINHLLHDLYPWMSDKMLTSSTDYLKMFFGGGETDPNAFWFSHDPRFRTSSKSEVFFRDSMKPQKIYQYFERLRATLDHIEDPLARAQYLEWKTLFNGYLISTQGDRMLMANGVEGRFPFLDPNVIDFGNRIPADQKLRVSDLGHMSEKHILKEFSSMLIPNNVRNRKKQPYMAPDGECFFGDNAPEYVDHLLTADYGYFKMDKVALLRKKFDAQRAKGFPDNMALIGILSTQSLHEQFVESFDMKKRVPHYQFNVTVDLTGI